MNSESRNILIVAGEASGDMHGAALVHELLKLDPSLRFYGVGGQKLKESGVELIADSSDMAVVGLTEVFRKLPFIMKVMSRLKETLKRDKPLVAILIDYPDFNLLLAKAAHKLGIRVFYYISPQVWAWRKGRIKKIRERVDKMAVILPFEAPLYHKAGVDVSFVGHPLLDMVPPHISKIDARRKIGLREDINTVSLLPGSRKGEVSKLLPVCLGAAVKMKRYGDMQFVLPLANTIPKKLVDDIIGKQNIEVSIISGAIYDVLEASDLAIAASGTVTLEAALKATPMIVIYKISWFSYLIGRMLISVKNICLANIIAGKTVVPELIQSQANPENIAQVAYGLLFDMTTRNTMQSELSDIRMRLGSPGASEKAARLVYAMLF